MRLRLLLLPLVVAIASSCTSGEKPVESQEIPKINMKQSMKTGDGILERTFEAIRPGVNWTHGQYTSSVCEDFKPAGKKTGAVTLRRAVMTDVSEERRGSFLGVIERHWKKEGYKITGVNNDRESPAIYASTPDGFRLSLTIGYRGQPFFSIVSPCALWSEGKSRLSETNGPNYMGKEIPRPPNHQDDFWSIKAPIKQQ